MDSTFTDIRTPEIKMGRQEWREKLGQMGREEGFYEDLGDEHTALFVRRGSTLIVTFENLDHVFERNDTRLPWAFDYVETRNWSILGLMAHDWTWYRDASVYDLFDRLRDEGFFKGFERVVFYGASMGGYAAATFSSAAPGSTVIAISPQATLDRDIARWETRYLKVWRRNFTDRYGYAPDNVAHADKVHLFFDPTAQLDAMHASLFQSDNVIKYRCRFMGHRIASLWTSMGILKNVVEEGIDGTLDRHKFYGWMRKRKDSTRYQKELLARIENLERPKLLIQYCQYILSKRRAPAFRHAMRKANAALTKKA